MTITDLTASFQDGLALCAIIHRYRPDLLDFASLDPANVAGNNQLAFDILEELGIPHVSIYRHAAHKYVFLFFVNYNIVPLKVSCGKCSFPFRDSA